MADPTISYSSHNENLAALQAGAIGLWKTGVSHKKSKLTRLPKNEKNRSLTTDHVLVFLVDGFVLCSTRPTHARKVYAQWARKEQCQSRSGLDIHAITIPGMHAHSTCHAAFSRSL